MRKHPESDGLKSSKADFQSWAWAAIPSLRKRRLGLLSDPEVGLEALRDVERNLALLKMPVWIEEREEEAANVAESPLFTIW